MLQLCKSLLRPHLEYAISAWSPHYIKDKKLLKRVQHRFTRIFDDLKDLEYLERLKALHLWTVEERRNPAGLIELYRITHGMSKSSFTIGPHQWSQLEIEEM